MDLSVVGLEMDAGRSSLLAIAVAGVLWYALRVLTALLLVAASRWSADAGSAALRCAPGPLRPWISRAMLGGLLAAGLTGPAAAADDGCTAGPAPILDRGDRCGAATEAGPADRSGEESPTGLPGGEQPAPESRTSITVSAGDSLWSISEALLGADATTASIAAAWPRLWQANAGQIGPDPGLIHPGQTLTVPAGLNAAVAP